MRCIFLSRRRSGGSMALDAIWYIHAWPRLKEAGSAVLNCCARSPGYLVLPRNVTRSSMTTNTRQLCIAITRTMFSTEPRFRARKRNQKYWRGRRVPDAILIIYRKIFAGNSHGTHSIFLTQIFLLNF